MMAPVVFSVRPDQGFRSNTGRARDYRLDCDIRLTRLVLGEETLVNLSPQEYFIHISNELANSSR